MVIVWVHEYDMCVCNRNWWCVLIRGVRVCKSKGTCVYILLVRVCVRVCMSLSVFVFR